MAFQLKTFTSIVAAMINHVRGTAPGLTDLNPGSVTRTMLEAPALEIDELYQQIFNTVRDAIPVATFTSFNFDRLEAAPATGLAVVTVAASSQAVTIPAETTFLTDSSRIAYISQAAVTIAAGQTTATVSLVATEPGVGGNVPASTSFNPVPRPSNFVSCANATRFDNGRAVETDVERKQRFVAYIRSLQRATGAALAYGAKTVARFNAAGIEIERVKAVSVVEPYLANPAEPFSLVKVYVHNGTGSTSGALVTEVAKVIHGYTTPDGVKINGWKAAGVKVDVIAATEVATAFTGTVTVQAGFSEAAVVAAAEDALERYVLSLDIGEPILFKEAIGRVAEIPGVVNIVFSAPTADVPATNAQKPMPGVMGLVAA